MRDEGSLNETQKQWFRDSKPEEELFDTWDDPHEINNIAENPEMEAILAELRTACNSWMEEIEDKGIVPEAELIDSFWPGNVQPKTSNPKVEAVEEHYTIYSSTPGASIGYQLVPSGEKLSEKWAVYTESIDRRPGTTLFTIADRIGYAPSEVVRVD
jgi:hypothetical protein